MQDLFGPDRSTRGQRGVLAERVARRRCRPQTMAVAQEEREGDSHEAERGLRVLGQPELILVRFGEQAAEALRFGQLVAELGDLGDLEELPSHPGLL